MTHEPLRMHVYQKLRAYWSPEQIAGRLKREGAPPEMQVCHETIYRFISEAAKAGVDYGPYLRQRHRRHTYGWRGKKRFKRIRDFKAITERPEVVDERSRWPGVRPKLITKRRLRRFESGQGFPFGR